MAGRVIVPAEGPLRATLRVPGSKSLTNRFIALAALAEGTSRLRRALRADDTDRLLSAVETLGAAVRSDGDDVLIDGVGGRFPRGGHVDLGDGGTPTRFVLALATLAAGPVVIDGSARMRERPVDEGIALLRELGARIDARAAVPAGGGAVIERLPATVHPVRPRGGELLVGRTASSQFLSALLLIGPALDRPLVLRHREPPTSASYLALTMDALATFGVATWQLLDEEGCPTEHGVEPQTIAAHEVEVEADASSAVYAAGAAALVPGSEVRLLGLPADTCQPDRRFFDAVASMGADVEAEADAVVVRCGGPLRGVQVDASDWPDASLALAALAAAADGVTVIRGLATLAVKETDRLAALATELERLGCSVERDADSLAIDPAGRHARPVTIDCYRDHRMAMSFAMLALARPGITIADPACVAKSYPSFWTDLDRLRDHLRSG